jgi:membrane protease YdiL (CAAX protease family)
MRDFAQRLFAPIFAGLIAFAITAIGQGLWGGLVILNMKTSPGLPWAAPTMLVLLVLLWRYLSGRGWPASTSAKRKTSLNAKPVSAEVMIWSLIAGGLGIVALAGGWIVAFQMIKMPLNVLTNPGDYPLPTMIAFLVLGSLAAPFSEEAAFRGYAQSILQRWYAAPVAIVITSVLFALAHFPQGLSLPKMSLYFGAGVLFGSVAYFARSIWASIPVHIAADLTFFTLVWPHDPARHLIWETGADAWFWIHAAQTVVFLALSVLAFRQLAKVAARGRAYADEASAYALPA